MKDVFPIETKRLLLRPLTLDDAEGMFELDSDPLVHKYLGKKPVKTIEESIEIIENIIWQYETKGVGRLAVIEKSTNAFTGWSGLKFEEKLRSDFNYYDIGYRFITKFWGKGYATESALASLDYGFKHLNLKEIGGAADWNNAASNAVLKKIGMQQNGTFTYKGTLCNWYVIKNLK